MSGFSPFGLSALGSMSTLGSLASAQRLDHLNDLLSRNQNSNWNRDKPRRSLDDDYFGGSGMGGGNRNRRSLSPPRHFDRDDRRSNQRRDRGNQRRSDKFGSSSGAGILGAAPNINDSMSGPPLSGLSDRGGFGSSNTWNDGGVPQLNSQTQQILNMMQTQQLLAAVQAQASLANPGPPSLMQNQIQGFPRQGGRNQRNDNQGRRDRFRSGGGGGGRYRDDRKRKLSPPRNPLPKRDRRENNSQATRSDKKDQSAKKTVAQNDKESSKKNKESKASKDVQEQEKQQGSGATPEQMEEPSTNAAGQDIKALVSENFDGKRYWCSLCKVVCLKLKNIYKHYLSKRHVKAVVESEGKTFDPEIMKEETSKPQDISELLKYVCNTRKIARKEKNDVYISSQTECTVKISDFATKQNFMGSEFVKAISGFKCQLCKVFLRSGHDVLYHIQGKRHKNNYEAYLKEHPKYPDTQFEVNKNLVEILEKQEGKDVLLFEVKNDEAVDGVQKADDAEENCKLEENDDEGDGAIYNMDEYDPTEDSKIEVDDSNVVDESETQEDSIVEETGMSEAPPEEEDEKADETEEEVEKSLLQEDGEEQEEEESQDVGQEEQLLMTPSEEYVKIPFLEASADTKLAEEDQTENKESEQENSKDEKEDIKTPALSSDLGLKEDTEEEEEVIPIPGKRVTRKGRGRGGNTRATRGKTKRRSTRAAKNLKKAEEVEESVKEAIPKETYDDISFIDGFEVIDEVVGGEDDD